MNRLLRTCVVACVVAMGVPVAAWADTTVIQDGQDGWTKITSIPSNVADYYFVFVDNSNDLMLEMRKGTENPNNALYYMTSQNPLLHRSFLWTLEANSGDYAGMYSIRNAEYTVLLMQTEWGKGYLWDTNNQANPCDWTALNIQYDGTNACWTLENGKYPLSGNGDYKGYLGPWKENNTNANLQSGQELAGNKSGDYIGHFQIYTIAKSTVALYYTSLINTASLDNPVDVSFYINNREANLSDLQCWTTTGVVTRNSGAATYDGEAGFFEPSDWWASSFTCTMSQSISGLPNGRYQVQAAAQASTGCTLTLSATDGSNVSAATLTSKGASGSSISSRGGWEWLNTGTVVVESNSITVNVTTSASAEHNWGNIDGFRLYYLGPLSTDYTSRITNPGFETGDLTGWTVATNNDTGVKDTTIDNYRTIGSSGSYLLNNWWTGTPVTQNIGVLPAGVYQLSADVATGNSATSLGTLYLNANEAHSTGYVSSNNKIMGTEYLIFQSDGTTETTIGLRGGEDATVAANDAIVKGAWNENGYWWYKVDNFQLKLLGSTQAELAEHLTALLASCAPYDDVADKTDYTSRYNTYKAYTASNTLAELTEAINYLTNEYDDYCWNNASVAHPVDVTATTITGADCTSNEAWPGSGRTTATGTYYDGSSRTYFTQNHENGAARSQDVTIRYEGAYLLRTIVKPTNANAYATITLGDESTTTKGVPTGAANIGSGWTYNDVYYGQNEINVTKKIQIALSNINASREADCGEMHLYYIGRNTDFVTDGTHKYVGMYATAPAIELTDDVPVANTLSASFSGATATFANPNGLLFALSGQVSNTENVVVNGTCEKLVLQGGHPFVNPSAFTATTATYTLGTGELAGGQFATLTLPFAATSLAGTAYTLDQDIDLVDGKVRATAVGSIAANAPVLVTTAGSYSGTDVSVPAVANGTTFTNGQLVGSYTAQTAPQGSYVLQNHTAGEGVAFYVVGTTRPTVGPFRAYIQPQGSAVKAVRVQFDETTGIEEIHNSQFTIHNSQFTIHNADGIVYDLQGRRVANNYELSIMNSELVPGVYIVNGKKVLIK